MTTQHLRKIRKRHARNAPSRAVLARRMSWVSLGIFLCAVAVALTLMALGIDVPGWAWERRGGGVP